MKSKFAIFPNPFKDILKIDEADFKRKIRNNTIYTSIGRTKEVLNYFITIDGYIIPRNSAFEKYGKLSQHKVVAELYKKHKLGFVNYLKGFFTIAIFDGDEIILANDIHSVKRFFIYDTPHGKVFSNDLSIIKKLNPSNNKFAPAIQATLQHFVKGITQFEGVKYSQPASLYHYQSGQWSNQKYFNPDELITCAKTITKMGDFNQIFYESINNTIKFLQPVSVSATLTGGRDTRSILAALLKMNIVPPLFYFWLPNWY